MKTGTKTKTRQEVHKKGPSLKCPYWIGIKIKKTGRMAPGFDSNEIEWLIHTYNHQT
jgi:hypothetical protein